MTWTAMLLTTAALAASPVDLGEVSSREAVDFSVRVTNPSLLPARLTGIGACGYFGSALDAVVPPLGSVEVPVSMPPFDYAAVIDTDFRISTADGRLLTSRLTATFVGDFALEVSNPDTDQLTQNGARVQFVYGDERSVRVVPLDEKSYVRSLSFLGQPDWLTARVEDSAVVVMRLDRSRLPPTDERGYVKSAIVATLFTDRQVVITILVQVPASRGKDGDSYLRYLCEPPPNQCHCQVYMVPYPMPNECSYCGGLSKYPQFCWIRCCPLCQKCPSGYTGNECGGCSVCGAIDPDDEGAEGCCGCVMCEAFGSSPPCLDLRRCGWCTR